MRPVTMTVTGVANSSPCPMDIRQNPQNTAIQVDVGSGCSYVVESTDSDLWGSFPFTTPLDPATCLWTPHPDFVVDGVETAKTVDWVGNYAFPPTAIRLRQTIGAAASVIRIVQSGF